MPQIRQPHFQISDYLQNQNANQQIQCEYEDLGLAIAIGPQYILCNIQDIIINDQLAQEGRLIFNCQNRQYRVKQILYQQEEYEKRNIPSNFDNKILEKDYTCEYAVLIIDEEIQEYVGILQIENSFYFLQDYDQYNENKCVYVLSNTFLLERYVQDIQQNIVLVEQINQIDSICPVYIHMDSNQTSSPLLIGFYKNTNKFKQGMIQLFDTSTYLQILSWVQGYQSISYTSKFTQEIQYPYENQDFITKEILQHPIEDKKQNIDSKQNVYKQGCVWKLQRLNHRVMCSSSGDFKLKIWDTTTNTLVRVLDLGNNICRDLICFNDILICASDNVLQIFNWETGSIIQKLTFKDKIQCLGQFELHKDVIATGHQNGYIHILKFSKRKNQWQAVQVIKNSQHEEHGHESFVNSIVGLRNYEMASAGTNGQIKIWNWQSGEFVKELQAHLPNKSVYFMKYLYDRDTLISGGSDKSIRIWDLKNNQFKEFIFQNPLYTVELITSRYLCVGDGQNVIIYDTIQSTATNIYSTMSRVNSIVKLNPNCFGVGDTDGQIVLFKYTFSQSINDYYQLNQNAYCSEQSNKGENPINRSPSKNVAETFCENEKSGTKSQYQTESHPISSLASPLEYNTKQSQPASNQNQDSSLLVQVNNLNANTDLNILLSNRSNLKKSETLTNQLKKLGASNQNLKEQFVNNNSSQLTTSRNDNNKYSFQENPLSSNFGQLSSNFTNQAFSNYNFTNLQLQEQQQEINEKKQALINEQNVFRIKLEDRDEQLKKVHQKYSKLFEQIFIILENYEANKLVLQHLKKDFESINQDLRKYFTNMDNIYIKQVKNLESIIQNKDKEQQIQTKAIQDALQAKQIQVEELQKSFESQKIIFEQQDEDAKKKNAYIELLSKQINEKDNMILDSQERIKELMQLVNGLQNKMSGKSITKINTPSKETPRVISSLNQQAKQDNQNDKENLSSFLTDKAIYSYRNQSKFQNTENNPAANSEPKIQAIVNSTKLLKNAQFPFKENQKQNDKILESSQVEKSIVNSNNSNLTEKILQTNLILNTPIKKDQYDKYLKTDNLTNSIKLTGREIDQQDIYESLSYKINNNLQKNSQGVIRSKSYSKPLSNLQNSQTSTNINQENSTFRIINSRNVTPDVKEKSLCTFESIQKQILQNNTSIINQASNTQISPIKSQFSPMSKKNGQIVIKMPQPTQVSTQSREDLIKMVNDPQPPSLQQILQTASEIENAYSRQSFETNKLNKFKSNQTMVDNQQSKENYDTIASYLSKENQGKKRLNTVQCFDSEQQIPKPQKQENLNLVSDQVSEKVIASKVGNITIQSRIIRSVSQKPLQKQL